MIAVFMPIRCEYLMPVTTSKNDGQKPNPAPDSWRFDPNKIGQKSVSGVVAAVVVVVVVSQNG